MEFGDLIGKEVTLVGCTEVFESLNNRSYDGYANNAMIVEFLLDNKTHILKILGDESDGYRSYLGEVDFITNKDEDYKNQQLIYLPPAKVRLISTSSTNIDLYEFKDELNHTWISFGTDNTDDYYPNYFLNISEIDLKSWREAKLGDIL